MISSMEEAIVVTLIDSSTRQWNHSIIDRIFAPEEADLIYKIPLGRADSDDSLFWPLTQDRFYSCKSGYCFLKEEAEMEIRGIDDNQGMVCGRVFGL